MATSSLRFKHIYLNFEDSTLRVTASIPLFRHEIIQHQTAGEREKPYRRKGVAGVGNEQASFPHGSVADGDAFNEPGSAHLVAGDHNR